MPCMRLKAASFSSKYSWSGVTVLRVSTEQIDTSESQRFNSLFGVGERGGELQGEVSGEDGSSSGVGTRPMGSTTYRK